MNHNDVKWPSGFLPFYRKVRELSETILQGTLLCIDPSSGGTSLPGFSVFVAGELITSGTLVLGERKMPIYERLQLLYPAIVELTSGPPDVFAIEMIRGQGFSSRYLDWAIGASMASARTANVLELPMHCWKAVAKVTPGYFKGDQQDAECIGWAMVLLAQKFKEESEVAS